MSYKRVKYIALFFVLFFLVLDTQVDAQSFYSRRRDKYWVITGALGVATYYGDLSNPGQLLDTRISFDGGLLYAFHSRYAARATLGFFNLQADDAKADDQSRVKRNLSFSSINIELTGQAVIYLFPEIGRFYQRPDWNAYLFVGLGLLYINPRTDIPAEDWDGNPLPNAGQMTSLRQYQTEANSYSNFQPVIPLGFGVKYKINPYWNIALEGSYRQTFTDYLDDVSTQHPGVDSFDDPTAAALSDRRNELGLSAVEPGTQRGNPENNDAYFTLMFRAEYYAFNKLRTKRYKPKRRRGRYR